MPIKIFTELIRILNNVYGCDSKEKAQKVLRIDRNRKNINKQLGGEFV